MLPLVGERCTVIELSYDERGLPQVDAEQLAAAIFSVESPNDEVVEKFQRIDSGPLEQLAGLNFLA